MKTQKGAILLTVLLVGLLLTYAFVTNLASAKNLEKVGEGTTAVFTNVTIIDDFNDGDVSDWGYFGGSQGGGGFGVADDRPFEGSHYLSTGWGGSGGGGFYGGMFKNFDDAAQPIPPANAEFSVWVYNQSNATSTGYTLEITIREDVEGDGWNGWGGTDESFRLDTMFISADYNDQWVQIKAPLTDFQLVDGNGGDGTFNGALDELVIVIAGVQGVDGATVEVDFDYFTLTPGAPPPVVIEDFNDGDVSDWGYFGGSQGGGGFGVADDRPFEGSHYLSTGWGGSGGGGFYGGMFKNFDDAAQPIPPANAEFSVWVYNQSNATSTGYTLEITIREDVEGDGWNGWGGTDESFRLDTMFISADYNDQWVQIKAPLTDFQLVDGNGGDGTFNGALDELVIVIAGVQGVDGATVEVDFDYFTFMSDVVAETSQVGFERGQFSVLEGGAATISVKLNAASTDVITVSYATSDGTAVANTDYTPISGTLVFPANTTVQTFTVQTIDDDLFIGNRTVNLTLSDPVNAELGLRRTAVLTIEEDETSNFCADRSLMINDFEDGLLPYGTDENGLDVGFFTWVGPNSAVDITTTLMTTNTVLQMNSNVTSWGGMTNHFTNETADTWLTQDWSSYAAVSFWVYGTNSGKELLFEIQDNRNFDSTVDDTEIFSYSFIDNFDGWRRFEVLFEDFRRKEISNGAPNDGFTLTEVHGWAFGSTGLVGTTYLDDVQICGTAPERPLAVAFERGNYSVTEGETAVLTVALSRAYTETVTVDYTTAESNGRFYQYTPISGTLTFPAGTLTQTISIDTYHDGKHTRDIRVAVNLYEGDGAPLGFQRRAILTVIDIDPADPRLVDDFQAAHPFIYQEGMVDLSITTLTDDSPAAVPGQWAYEDVLTVEYDGPASFGRVFAEGQDWSAYDGLSFWFYGQNSGDSYTVQLRENMAATTAEIDPNDWVLVWSDEFNGPAGARPNPNVWKFELGDGALNNIVGWGNSEFQFYTDSAENSFMDGTGNLVIRLQDTAPDTDLVCWYGPCEYTSARLLTQDRLDFEYGRIEARVQVPGGPNGLWPAFWMLGSNIPEVGWPQSGEIDIMEYVSRLPYEVFGTIHGPGYEGGASFGNTLTFTDTVPNQGFLTYGVEWMPDLIIWYVDDVQYHQAVPADVAPREWVFNHPFFMLLNAAIGGNFGGAISGDMTFPQDTLVDYVRVYQAADTAERFEASFVDNFTGWRKISLPFAAFSRSAEQPIGAPDDGLTLTEVWGYDIILPADGDGLFHMDRVYLEMTHDLYLPLIFR